MTIKCLFNQISKECQPLPHKRGTVYKNYKGKCHQTLCCDTKVKIDKDCSDIE